MLRVLALLLTALAVSCSRPPPDSTPEGALREWLDAMDAQTTDPAARKRAYDLLSQSTRVQLEKRAERSSRIEGHRVQPDEVIAEGRFALRFAPRHFRATVTGDAASVEVSGDESTQVATMRCMREGKVWRVVLDLPDIVDLPHRSER